MCAFRITASRPVSWDPSQAATGHSIRLGTRSPSSPISPEWTRVSLIVGGAILSGGCREVPRFLRPYDTFETCLEGAVFLLCGFTLFFGIRSYGSEAWDWLRSGAEGLYDNAVEAWYRPSRSLLAAAEGGNPQAVVNLLAKAERSFPGKTALERLKVGPDLFQSPLKTADKLRFARTILGVDGLRDTSLGKTRNRIFGYLLTTLAPEEAHILRGLLAGRIQSDREFLQRLRSVRDLIALIPHLKADERGPSMLAAAPTLGQITDLDQYAPVMEKAFEEAVKFLRPSDRLALAEEFHASQIRRGSKLPVLDKLASLLDSPEKMHLAEKICERGIEDLDLSLMAKVLDGVPGTGFLEFAARRQSAALLRLATFHSYHLPYTGYFWERFLGPESEGYMQRLAAGLAAFRRGRLLGLTVSEEDLRLAYASLDDPDDLTYEHFRAQVNRHAPPAPFLQTPFQGGVRLMRSQHGRIDKGVVTKALTPLTQVRTTEAAGRMTADMLKDYLSGLIEREHKALRKVRRGKGGSAISKGFEDVFPGGLAGLQVLSLPEMIKGVREILPSLWAGWQERQMPLPVQELVVHLILFLAWAREGTETLRLRIEEIMKPRYSSVKLVEGLRALGEFYGDAVEEVCREIRIPAEKIPFIRRQRQILQDEVGRIRKEPGREVAIEFVPSKSQTDRFFGYVGEDCAFDKGDVIDGPDFEIVRMVSEERLVGMLYLQQAVLDGKKVLVIAVQPRSNWEIDYPGLLQVVEKNLSQIVGEEGYDFLLLRDDLSRQSNRLDMLDAIQDRGYPKIVFEEGLANGIFVGSGNKDWATPARNFLVIWSRDPLPASLVPTAAGKAPSPVIFREAPAALDRGRLLEIHLAAMRRYPMAERLRMTHLSRRLRDAWAEALREAGFVPDAPVAALIRAGGTFAIDEAPQPGRLVLFRKSLEQIFLNPRVTRTDHGWIEPTLPSSGDEVTPQDLFDFYNAVFYQAFRFRPYLLFLKTLGAEIGALVPVIERIDSRMNDSRDHLFAGRFDECLQILREVDGLVSEFQRVMREIAAIVGVGIHPVTGDIYSLTDGDEEG